MHGSKLFACTRDLGKELMNALGLDQKQPTFAKTNEVLMGKQRIYLSKLLSGSGPVMLCVFLPVMNS